MLGVDVAVLMITAAGGMTNSSGGMGMLGVGLGIIAAAWE